MKLRLQGAGIVREHSTSIDDLHIDDDLYIEDGVVSSVGSAEAESINLGGHYILPGLINCHDHLQLNAAPELRPSRIFEHSSQWIDWLNSKLDRDGLPPGLDAASDLRHWQGALKNVLAGVTTVAHHDPIHEVLVDPDLPVKLASCGWAHSIDFAGQYGATIEESRRTTPAGQPWIVHLAEGTDARSRAELGQLEVAGGIDGSTVVVHAVGLDSDGRERLLQAGASVIWCPESNSSMLGQTIDPRHYLETGRIGIGTDSRLTGADDLLDELRSASSASGLTPAELAPMVTTNAARILRLAHAGCLSEGCPADLVVLRCQTDPWANLLQARRAELRAVIINGRPVVSDPDLAPWFAAVEVETIEVLLDGRPKLMARSALGPPGAIELEPGLEMVLTGSAR